MKNKNAVIFLLVALFFVTKFETADAAECYVSNVAICGTAAQRGYKGCDYQPPEGGWYSLQPSEMCTVGTPSTPVINPQIPSEWMWSCDLLHYSPSVPHSRETCYTTRVDPPVSYGSCGYLHGEFSYLRPDMDPSIVAKYGYSIFEKGFCSTVYGRTNILGNSSDPTGWGANASPWTWTCLGKNGGNIDCGTVNNCAANTCVGQLCFNGLKWVDGTKNCVANCAADTCTGNQCWDESTEDFIDGTKVCAPTDNGCAANTCNTTVCWNNIAYVPGTKICTVAPPGPVIGTCGNIADNSYASMPAEEWAWDENAEADVLVKGFCGSGNVTSINGSGPWTWNCLGLNGGADSPQCIAQKNCASNFSTNCSIIEPPSCDGHSGETLYGTAACTKTDANACVAPAPVFPSTACGSTCTAPTITCPGSIQIKSWREVAP